MGVPAPITRVHDINGDLRADLSPPVYRRFELGSFGGVTYRRNVDDNGAYVGGSHEVTPAVPASTKRIEMVSVYGGPGLDEDAYWALVDDRVETLARTTFATSFLWAIAVGGRLHTYRSIGPADVVPRINRQDLMMRRRVVTVTFDVQPDFTVTPIGA